MEEQSNRSLYNIINVIIGTYFKLISDVFKIFNLESLLAKKSLIKIIILALFAGVILFSTWLSLLGLLLIYLIQLHYGWIISMSAIALLNILILLIIVFIIMRLKNNLSFSATRRQISKFRNKESVDDRIKATDKTT